MAMEKIEDGVSQKGSADLSENEYKLQIFHSSVNLLAHIFIGIVLGASFLFAFVDGLPLGDTPLHIILCVTGYQLLMAEAFLSLSPHNSWSANLRLVDKRRAHWILQLLGSVLAIVGSIIKVLDKPIHWNTLHGQFALVALVFTTVSLVNGLVSLWAFEVRKFIPPKLSKLTHICFGIVAFAAANISLCYGFDKPSFTGWAGQGMTYTIIALVAYFTLVIITDPFITFVSKIKGN